MNVLIACEESQAVCIEMRKKGHNAFSCDIQECSGGHPEWHLCGDIDDVLWMAEKEPPEWAKIQTQDGQWHKAPKWDMVIAFPPCTHLAVSGACRFEKKREDGRQREAIEFFCKFLSLDCEKVVIENPVNIISGKYVQKWFPDLAEKYGLPKKPTQAIHPWMFGHDASKKTCLWIKGLPELKPTNIVDPDENGRYSNQTKDGQNKLIVDGKWIGFNDPRTAKYRSKTYSGIAKAMSDTWG